MDIAQRITAPLFVPGDQPDLFAKAAHSIADAVIIDLEDAVAPQNKDFARNSLKAHGINSLPLIIRVNPRSSPDYAKDMEAASAANPAAIMLPKAETLEDVQETVDRTGGNLPIIALIETACGLTNLPSLLRPEQVACAAFGAFDFSLDIGCEAEWEPLLLARSELVWRSRAAHKSAPWDSPSGTINNPELVEKEALRAMKLGFGGKLAIHPSQILSIQRAFAPEEKQVSWAQRVVQACQNGEAVQLDGAMIDKPVLERARKILKIYEARRVK